MSVAARHSSRSSKLTSSKIAYPDSPRSALGRLPGRIVIRWALAKRIAVTRIDFLPSLSTCSALPASPASNTREKFPQSRELGCNRRLLEPIITLMWSERHGLLCWVDAQPSEQVCATDPDTIHTVVGLIASNPEPFRWLRQYKQVRGADRKVKHARRLESAIAPPCRVQGIACTATADDYRRYGDHLMPSFPHSLMHRDDSRYHAVGTTHPESFALAAPTYAASLLVIAAWARAIAHGEGHAVVTLFVDSPPFDDESAGSMRLLQLVAQHGELAHAAHGSIAHESDKLDAYIGRAPTDHALSNLVDWIARSVNAELDGRRWLMEGAEGRTEEQRQAIAAPFVALRRRGSFRVFDVGNLAKPTTPPVSPPPA